MSMRSDPNNLEELHLILEESLNSPMAKVDYPKEALPVGTYIRSTRLDKLGIIISAFYGDRDKDGKKIVVYTVLLYPENSLVGTYTDQFYVSNEYEYEIIAYLMIGRANLSDVADYFKQVG